MSVTHRKPQTGTFLQFLNLYLSLDPSDLNKAFIAPAEKPGHYSFCVFPTATALPSSSQRYIQAAEAVRQVIDSDMNGTLFPGQKA